METAVATDVLVLYLYDFGWAWPRFPAQEPWWAPIERGAELAGFRTVGNWFQPVFLA